MGYFDDPTNPLYGMTPEDAQNYFRVSLPDVLGRIGGKFSGMANAGLQSEKNFLDQNNPDGTPITSDYDRLDSFAHLMRDNLAPTIGAPAGALGAGPKLAPIRAYHASLTPDITSWRPYTHFGTPAAAEQRVNNLLEMSPSHWPYGAPRDFTEAAPTTYPVDLHAQKPTPTLGDPGDWTDAELAHELHFHGLLSDKELRMAQNGALDPWEHLKSQGYDLIPYKNAFEDAGSTSYMALDPKIIKSAITKLGLLPFAVPAIGASAYQQQQ